MVFPLWIKIVVIMLSGGLFALGGYVAKYCRRFILPSILALTASIEIFNKDKNKAWQGLLLLPAMITVSLGYHDRGWVKRGSWLALQAFMVGLGLCITGHLVWWIYALYTIIAFVLGATLYNIKQLIGDTIFGCWVAIIILFIY